MALRRVFAVWMLAFPVLSFAAAPPAPPGEPIIVGQRFQLRSESIGEMRSFLVHRPPTYDFSNARYPVLFVLDGDEHFQHVSATVDLLAATGKIPEMLVIGIPNTDRARDLVPSVGGADARSGAGRFAKFLREELIPRIDRDYRTRPYRVLAGHSNGALLALYSMITAPEAFRGYLVMSPAFDDGEDTRALLKAIDSFLRNQKVLNDDVFMSTANETTQTLIKGWECASYLQYRVGRARDLRFTFRRYTEETHMSSPLRAVYEGLQAIFDGWYVPNAFALYEQGGLAGIEKHFDALSARLGYTVPIPQQVLTDIFGQIEYSRARASEAEAVIKRSIELYPNDVQSLYYAARLYSHTGNRPLALEMLKKALTLSPTDRGSRNLLKSLNVDVKDVIPEAHVNAKGFAKYLGGYGTSSVVFQILRRGDELIGKTLEHEYALEPVSDTQLRYVDDNLYSYGGDLISFRIDSRGRVTGLSFQAGGAELAKLN